MIFLEKKPNFFFYIFLVIFLFSLFLIFRINVYADSDVPTLIEDVIPNINQYIEENKEEYPYYIVIDDEPRNQYLLYFFDNFPGYVEVFDEPYKKNGTTFYWHFVVGRNNVKRIGYVYEKTGNWYKNPYATENYFGGADIEFDSVIDNILYSNFQGKTKNGTVVFSVTPALPIMINGRISSRSILKIWKKIISGITVLLIGFLISVIAFRKGWAMLKTVLKQA